MGASQSLHTGPVLIVNRFPRSCAPRKLKTSLGPAVECPTSEVSSLHEISALPAAKTSAEKLNHREITEELKNFMCLSFRHAADRISDLRLRFIADIYHEFVAMDIPGCVEYSASW